MCYAWPMGLGGKKILCLQLIFKFVLDLYLIISPLVISHFGWSTKKTNFAGANPSKGRPQKD